MPIDPRTLAPQPPKAAAAPVFFAYDGGTPSTTFTDTVDGGTPTGTGAVMNDTKGTP